MNALTAERTGISVEEYLEGERHSEIRHEYAAGDVYAMVGASRRHGLIVNGLAFALTPDARRAKCQLFTADMKVRLRVGDEDFFYYPDLVLGCDDDDDADYYLTRPCLIIEVLSDTTERIDRREKLLAYQTIPSLEEYILVAQDKRRIEIFRRANDWHRETHTEGVVELDCLETALSLDETYRDVDV